MSQVVLSFCKVAQGHYCHMIFVSMALVIRFMARTLKKLGLLKSSRFAADANCICPSFDRSQINLKTNTTVCSKYQRCKHSFLSHFLFS